MNWLLFAVALAGCGTDGPPTTLPADAHYRTLLHSWPTIEQCLEHDPEACAVPWALSLCESGRAVRHENGVTDVGTYAMDEADQGQHSVATIITGNALFWFDVEAQALVGASDTDPWDVDDDPDHDCDP